MSRIACRWLGYAIILSSSRKRKEIEMYNENLTTTVDSWMVMGTTQSLLVTAMMASPALTRTVWKRRRWNIGTHTNFWSWCRRRACRSVRPSGWGSRGPVWEARVLPGRSKGVDVMSRFSTPTPFYFRPWQVRHPVWGVYPTWWRF